MGARRRGGGFPGCAVFFWFRGFRLGGEQWNCFFDAVMHGLMRGSFVFSHLHGGICFYTTEDGAFAGHGRGRCDAVIANIISLALRVHVRSTNGVSIRDLTLFRQRWRS